MTVTDIVVRLRKRAVHYAGDTPWQSSIRQDHTEAADQIERLRSALKELVEAASYDMKTSYWSTRTEDAIRRGRTVLNSCAP